jgi:origin recognition complex subunit 1
VRLAPPAPCALLARLVRRRLSATPTKLQCREKERSQIDSFLREFLRDANGDGRLLYISGMPGTGKTATVREAAARVGHGRPGNAVARTEPRAEHRRPPGGDRVVRGTHRSGLGSTLSVQVVSALRADGAAFDFVDINGMCLPHATHAYSVLWKFLSRARPERVSHESAARKLEAFFTARAARDAEADDDHPYTIVLLDELDFMVTRTQAVLYNLFEWPSRSRSRLAIIGP